MTAFLPDPSKAPPALERWKPYQTWWRNVSRGDTVVTFNYHLVLEHLARTDPGKLFVVPPGHDADLPSGVVHVLKLHGSVDWRRLPGTGVPDRYVTGEADDFAVICEDYELAIASPGLTKQRMVKDAFSSLWMHAEVAIKGAKSIVFVGYRFPPTDSEALERLLGAIGENSELYLALHTVCAQDSASSATPWRRARRRWTASDAQCSSANRGRSAWHTRWTPFTTSSGSSLRSRLGAAREETLSTAT